jgi:hypothetical protein
MTGAIRAASEAAPIARSTPRLAQTLPRASAAEADFHPHWVVRGGLSEPRNLQDNVSELLKEGHPGSYGISSAMDPNGVFSPEAIAVINNLKNRQLTYNTAPVLNGKGYESIPTPLPGQPLHASILLKPGETTLSPEEAELLSKLLQQNRTLNPNFVKPVKPPKK